MADERLALHRVELEQVLVRQFQTLKELIALTKKERAALLSDPDLVLRVVEEKEALLDNMGLEEDRCRKIVQEISLLLGVRNEGTSIGALLPFFQPADASRIRNLADGIFALAAQAREMNQENKAITSTKLDWLKATQAFLISILQPDNNYGSGIGRTTPRDPTGFGVEVRA